MVWAWVEVVMAEALENRVGLEVPTPDSMVAVFGGGSMLESGRGLSGMDRD
jgi:hypothetical protein